LEIENKLIDIVCNKELSRQLFKSPRPESV